MQSQDSAAARKARSIKILNSENVPFIDHLPMIESETDSLRRTTEEVANRAMALCIVAVKGEGLEQGIIDNLVTHFQLAEAFTPNESKFIKEPTPSQHDRVQFGWQYECYWVMLWALQFIEELKRPDTVCDVPHAVTLLQNSGRETFLQQADLRSQSELLDAADLIYRYHWAVVDARLKGKDSPAGLDPGVVLERHYALNWLVGYMNQDWDDISTDT